MSIFQIIIVIASAAFSVWNLKKFFVKKAIFWKCLKFIFIFILYMICHYTIIQQLYNINWKCWLGKFSTVVPKKKIMSFRFRFLLVWTLDFRRLFRIRYVIGCTNHDISGSIRSELFMELSYCMESTVRGGEVDKLNSYIRKTS